MPDGLACLVRQVQVADLRVRKPALHRAQDVTLAFALLRRLRRAADEVIDQPAVPTENLIRPKSVTAWVRF